jgi:hypothetical protein
MTSNVDSYEESWKRFRDARAELYRPPAREIIERGGAELTGANDAKLDSLLDSSLELRGVLEKAVETGDSDLQDLASIKLIAAAAYDLSVAADLFERGERPAGPIERGPQFDPLEDNELYEILKLPLDKSAFKKFVAVERGGQASKFDPARDELDNEVTKFLKEIPKKAVELSGTAFSGALAFTAPGTQLESVLENEFLSHVPKGLSWVAKLVIEAIQKLWSALGKDTKSQVLDEAKKWLEEAKQKGADKLADWLYDVATLDQTVHAMVRNAQGKDVARINDATKRLRQLLGRYGKTKSALTIALRIFASFDKGLWVLSPWGPVIVYGVYTLVFGYAVYSGGDYLDSPRFAAKWLDHVQGLEGTVRRAVI